MILFIDPSEFDFINHFSQEDKEYLAKFLVKMSKKYYYLEKDDFLSIAKIKILEDYKKKVKNLKINKSFLGSLRVTLYRANCKCINNDLVCSSIDLKSYYSNLIVSPDCDMQDTLIDIEKILEKEKILILLKKINGEPLTRAERYIYTKIKAKIDEYLKI